MRLRKREDAGNLNRKIALCGELALEEAMDVSQDRLRHDDPIVRRRTED
jgi:hypothetical protein